MLQTTEVKTEDVGEHVALIVGAGGARSKYEMTEQQAVFLWEELGVLLAKRQRGKKKPEDADRERVSHVVE